jgi:hypothetical protein
MVAMQLPANRLAEFTHPSANVYATIRHILLDLRAAVRNPGETVSKCLPNNGIRPGEERS